MVSDLISKSTESLTNKYYDNWQILSNILKSEATIGLQGWDLAEWLERECLSRNGPGFDPASSNTLESEGGRWSSVE